MHYNNDDDKSIKKYIFLFILFFLILKCLSYKIIISSNFKCLISFVQTYNELKKIKNYLKFCENKKIIKKYKKKKNPKISVISPIYNRDRYISRFLKMIQNQNFKNLEIILVDDSSKDNSIKLIEEYKNKDKRITLIKNKINKGTFISRNIGVLYSKGKYLILPDPDDIINKNILNFCYRYAEKYNYEIIRYKMYKGNGITTSFNEANKINNQLEEKEINQPELSSYMFYGNVELQIIDYYIHNKFFKKEIFVKALSSLNNFYFNMYITLWEDTIVSFIIYRTAKSFFFLKKIGYYYVKNSQSITKNILKTSEFRIIFIFLFLKFVFENSKNSKYEKDMANLLFTELNQNHNIGYRLSSPFFKRYYNFLKNIINMYLNCKFISKNNKIILLTFKKILEKKL
jgi:glycosyltransferase involved in cell wall biosynthesis